MNCSLTLNWLWTNREHFTARVVIIHAFVFKFHVTDPSAELKCSLCFCTNCFKLHFNTCNDFLIMINSSKKGGGFDTFSWN